MPATWSYAYSDKKRTINLFSMEGAKERRTHVGITALLPDKTDTIQKIDELFHQHVRELRPNTTFTTKTLTLAGATVKETSAPRVRFRGRDGYSFRYITVPSEKGHFFLSIAIYQPNTEHKEEVERLLSSLQLLDGSPLPPLPDALKGVKRIAPLPASEN